MNWGKLTPCSGLMSTSAALWHSAANYTPKFHKIGGKRIEGNKRSLARSKQTKKSGSTFSFPKELRGKLREVNPQDGEAYTALAWVQLYWYLDPAAAGPAFERALELAPNYAQAHYSYAQYLETAGRPYEAVNEVKQAILLDPLSHLFNSGLGSALAETGQLEEAVKQFKVVLKMNPQFAGAHGGLGNAYLTQGKYTEAIKEFQTEGKMDGNFELGSTGYAYARSGNKKQALKILSQLYALQKPPGVSFDLAMVQLGLGNKEKEPSLGCRSSTRNMRTTVCFGSLRTPSSTRCAQTQDSRILCAE